MEERRLDIIKRVYGGEQCSTVALVYGISRERVRQIFKKATGNSPGNVLMDVRKEIRLNEKLKKDASVIGKCEYCGKPLIYGIEKRSGRYKYCKECIAFYRATSRRLNHTAVCITCGETFPLGSGSLHGGWKSNHCSRGCYHPNHRLGVKLSAETRERMARSQRARFAKEPSI